MDMISIVVPSGGNAAPYIDSPSCRMAEVNVTTSLKVQSQLISLLDGLEASGARVENGCE
jgi:hypothetical protein